MGIKAQERGVSISENHLVSQAGIDFTFFEIGIVGMIGRAEPTWLTQLEVPPATLSLSPEYEGERPECRQVVVPIH
jgi:hypothetical protein